MCQMKNEKHLLMKWKYFKYETEIPNQIWNETTESQQNLTCYLYYTSCMNAYFFPFFLSCWWISKRTTFMCTVLSILNEFLFVYLVTHKIAS